jgi:hypothetical protein
VIHRRHVAGALALAATAAACGAAPPAEHRPTTALRNGSATPALRHVVTGDAVRAQRGARRARERTARRKAGYVTVSGRGRQWLPAVEVRSGSTMAWRNSGRFFQVYDQHDVVAVTSVAHCGVAPLPAGHEQLKVNAGGRWTVRISPRHDAAMMC